MLKVRLIVRTLEPAAPLAPLARPVNLYTNSQSRSDLLPTLLGAQGQNKTSCLND